MSDLIKRQDAIDEFKSWLEVKGYSDGERNIIKAVLYELKNLPSSTQWIPCSERLPEENKYVLVYWGDYDIAKLVKGISKEERKLMKEGKLTDPIVAGWTLADGYFEHRRSDEFSFADEDGNNIVPYAWITKGGHTIFGQNVTAWMPYQTV